MPTPTNDEFLFGPPLLLRGAAVIRVARSVVPFADVVIVGDVGVRPLEESAGESCPKQRDQFGV